MNGDGKNYCQMLVSFFIILSYFLCALLSKMQNHIVHSRKKKRQRRPTHQKLDTTNNEEKSTIPINKHRHNTYYEVRKDLLERFQQFNFRQSFNKIYAALQRSIGRHSVTNYQSKYNFQEQWQVSKRFQDIMEYRTNFLYGCLDFVLLSMIIFCLIFISIKLFFQVNNSEWVYYIVCTICILKICKKIQNVTIIFSKQILFKFSKDLTCIALSIIISVLEQQLRWISYFGIVIVILLYFKSCKLYQHIKIFYLSSKYREVVQIFDLFVLLLAVSHVFALLLFATTYLHPQKNWMTNIDLEDDTWITKYIYSLYFSCTTLLTVGYGDISPKNTAEILMILLTQLIGIATFAYAVNQIGAALTNITERAQKLQKDLGNVEHIGNQYKLKPQLVCRMRTQLIKDKTLDSQLNLIQQTQLFGKFSEDLREQIQLESSMRVIKRSMFMIGNWTGKLQYKIARKLIKEIYAIDESLPQTFGKEKIYILEKGKIDVISNTKSGFKVCFQKILKTLSILPTSEVVAENVYGYSAVISNRQIHLDAIAKVNSICYSISKITLFELLAQSEEDLQHFHELKSKIDLSKIPQEIETPSIINFRQHYCPSILFIIAQYYSRKNKKNKRKNILRNDRKSKIRCFKQAISSSVAVTRKQLMLKSNYNESYTNIFRQQSEYSKSSDSIEEICKSNINLGKQQILGFESCKEFQKYYKKSNYQNVLSRLKLKIYQKEYQLPEQTCVNQQNI